MPDLSYFPQTLPSPTSAAFSNAGNLLSGEAPTRDNQMSEGLSADQINNIWKQRFQESFGAITQKEQSASISWEKKYNEYAYLDREFPTRDSYQDAVLVHQNGTLTFIPQIDYLIQANWVERLAYYLDIYRIWHQGRQFQLLNESKEVSSRLTEQEAQLSNNLQAVQNYASQNNLPISDVVRCLQLTGKVLTQTLQNQKRLKHEVKRLELARAFFSSNCMSPDLSNVDAFVVLILRICSLPIYVLIPFIKKGMDLWFWASRKLNHIPTIPVNNQSISVSI